VEPQVTCSVWGPFCRVEPRVVCPECSLFVTAVRGIRGPYWHGRERAGRRRSYRTGSSREGAVTVSGQFFDLFVNETCARWLDHLADQDDPRGHTCELPAWIARLPESVDFDHKVGQDAAARVAAAVLGVSVRSVYRAVFAPSSQHR
jgi:hypothetical protein